MLRRHLALDLRLEAPQQKRPQHAVQALDELAADRLARLDGARQRVGEPVLELRVRRKDVRHQKVHQRPQLHEVVLQRRARDQQPPLRVEAQQRLPALRLPVLDHVRLVEDQVAPLLAAEHLLID